MSKQPTLTINFVARDAATNGPRRAETWRNSVRELSQDLAQIASNWNTYVIPLVKSLPDGTGTTAQRQDDFGDDLNTFSYGLDGSQLYIDADTDASEESGFFWNSSRNRPLTVKEITYTLKQLIETTETNLLAEINDVSSGLSASEKAAIGNSIFGLGSSSPSSLDGRITTNANDITYLKRDIYNDSNHNLSSALSYSLKEMLEALLSLHGVANWSTDPSGVSHSAIDLSTLTTGQLDPEYVEPTSTNHSGDTGYPDNYSSTGSGLDDELGYIKTVIRTLKGLSAGNWDQAVSSTLPKSTSGQATNVYEILNNVKASGTQSASNPWGYRTDNIEIPATGIYTTANNQPYTNLQDNLDWICDPSDTGTTTDNTFRRQKVTITSLANGSTQTITHNRGAWPLVQVFEYNPSVYNGSTDWVHNTDVTVTQQDDNTTNIYNGSGHTIDSGIAILLW